MELSVCIITKNEKEKLKNCLEALQRIKEKGQDFEIVIADTGSTDGTKEMAAEYTDRIFDFVWQDDFSLARNFVAGKASNHMIMMLDSDEYVKQMDCEGLKQAWENFPGLVGRIRRINLLDRDGEQQEISEYISRIYDRRLYHYEGRIHEQVIRIRQADQPVEKDCKTYPVNIVVEHDGYCGSGDALNAKIRRNITMLQRELAEQGDDPYLCYQLGKAYYVAKDYEAAVAAFDRALCQELNPRLEYVIDMIQAYGYSLLKSGKTAQALTLEGVYEDFGDTADFRFLMGLIYMNNGLFDRAVDEFLGATKVAEAYTKGANSYLAYYNAGVIRECLGDMEQAKEFYAKCGDYPRARERLVSIK
ncbi:MAG: glycosyltransferase [Lachnospiraceae bacterium]